MLRQDLLETQAQAFAKGTQKNLRSQWKKFLLFQQCSGLTQFPVSESVVCLYIQFLSRSLKSPVSVRNYVSGLKCLHELLGFKFPSYDSIAFKLTFKGLDRVVQHVTRQAEPITVKLLSSLYKVLDMSVPNHVVYWCLFLFLFLLFARKSQFVCNTLDPQQVEFLVTRQDIRLEGNMLLVTFTWTKTRQVGGKPLVVPLAPIPGSHLCPVKAYKLMLQMVPAPPMSPAFVLYHPVGLRPVLYHSFHKVLRSCLEAVGLDPARYSSHSFRRGGTTFAFACGLPSELIKAQGDWKSDAYSLYIDITESQRIIVAKTLAKKMYRKV